ncbi:MAG: hypothetical protein GY804_00815 [Alphaproteobacteria bacterium]|nr:hypothetical protein [Alphaproteobacteria bacterium]
MLRENKMGLDASVNCSCFRKGVVVSTPPHSSKVYIDDEGFVNLRSDDLDELTKFDSWRINACKHEDMCAVHHYIGNSTRIRGLRSEICSLVREETIPIIMGKVLYSSIHAGDYLTTEDMYLLQSEIELLLLESEKSNYKGLERCMIFIKQMTELIDAAI